jgi:hypothetical protein
MDSASSQLEGLKNTATMIAIGGVLINGATDGAFFRAGIMVAHTLHDLMRMLGLP